MLQYSHHSEKIVNYLGFWNNTNLIQLIELMGILSLVSSCSDRKTEWHVWYIHLAFGPFPSQAHCSSGSAKHLLYTLYALFVWDDFSLVPCCPVMLLLTPNFPFISECFSRNHALNLHPSPLTTVACIWFSDNYLLWLITLTHGPVYSQNQITLWPAVFYSSWISAMALHYHISLSLKSKCRRLCLSCIFLFISQVVS